MQQFNIRVYGILQNDRHEVLISHEHRHNRSFTKFPGGGLEWGEGIKECLVREFQEELNVNIIVKELFYLTDYFQVSAFQPKDQLISIYYKVVLVSDGELDFPATSFSLQEDGEAFEWCSLDKLSTDSVTFPIDKIVVEKLVREMIEV